MESVKKPPSAPGTTYLYRLFSRDDVLLYVGISNDIGRRWKDHMREKSWWKEVRRMSTEVHDTWDDAREAELAAILAEYPVHNTADVPVERLLARDLVRLLRSGAVPREAGTMILLQELGRALDDHLAGEVRLDVLTDEEYQRISERWQMSGQRGQEPEPEVLTALKALPVPPVRQSVEPSDRDADSDRRLHPTQLRMRWLLMERGPDGYQAGKLWDELCGEGMGVARETVSRWLNADEKRGYVFRTGKPCSRWVWRLDPREDIPGMEFVS